MPAHRLVSLAALTAPLLLPFDALAAGAVAPADVDAFVQALPAPGGRDREFLRIPVPLQARLAIAPAVIRGIDPGVVCDPSAKAPTAFVAALGRVAQVQTICTPAGTSTGVLTLANGAGYTTTCGAASTRVTARLDVVVGSASWDVAADSAPPAGTPSRSCSGWTKMSR